MSWNRRRWRAQGYGILGLELFGLSWCLLMTWRASAMWEVAIYGACNGVVIAVALATIGELVKDAREFRLRKGLYSYPGTR